MNDKTKIELYNIQKRIKNLENALAEANAFLISVLIGMLIILGLAIPLMLGLIKY